MVISVFGRHLQAKAGRYRPTERPAALIHSLDSDKEQAHYLAVS